MTALQEQSTPAAVRLRARMAPVGRRMTTEVGGAGLLLAATVAALL